MDQLRWQPTASIESLRERARILQRIRAFFDQYEIVEVDTPLISQSGTPDPHLQSFTTYYLADPSIEPLLRYLHTSPEFPMKRLLAAQMGSIFQICKVFRQGERGRVHNPEFTMLEWYRPGFSFQQLIDEVLTLFTHVVGAYQHLLAPEQITYQQLFLKYMHIDPLIADDEVLKNMAQQKGAEIHSTMSRNDWLDLLMSLYIEPELGKDRATCVTHYPADQAALARIDPANPAVAERFELYYQGVELANGFTELTDAREQRKRFEHENMLRKQSGLAEIHLDEHFLHALESGMPQSSGVAIGIDRLVMVALGKQSLDQVMAFPIEIS
jgi:lysyl-tRNA synthetase class 2